MDLYITHFFLPLLKYVADNNRNGIIELFAQGYEMDIQSFPEDLFIKHLAVMAKCYASIYN